MAFDAFMSIKDGDGKTIRGETTDEVFGKDGASEILSFSFSSYEAHSQILSIMEGMKTAPPLSIPPLRQPPPPPPLKETKDVPEMAKMLASLQKWVTNALQEQQKALNEQSAQLAKDLQEQSEQQAEAIAAVADDVDRLEASLFSDEFALSASDKPEGRKKGSKLQIHVNKLLDSSSWALLKAYCQASDRRKGLKYDPFKSVSLYFRKAGGPAPVVYLKIELSDVDVTGYSIEVNSGSEPPKESINFSFDKFNVEYTAQSAKGKESTKSKSSIIGWDFEKNDVAV